ncbi:PREDICTED: vomeronasal type-2 receptor 116-like [Chinchilla lanigera]|uniref:vomeronasal type-2 receptor 116-like n=1 Tax=Chinchilla lanigera TaxID=34839 RepID=UPI000697172C|nr:PREDICTED: vomeronasal type-2 receptor 116-like [Chinchilla lanigera]
MAFPSLYQMASKDTTLALGVVSLMLHFSWTWVGLVLTEGPKGLQFLSDVRAEMGRNRVCVAFWKIVSSSSQFYVFHPQQHNFLIRETSLVKVVFIYYDTDSLNDVNHYIGLRLVTGTVWVTNSQWHADLTGKKFILDTFHGTLIFSNHHEEISDFKKFIHRVNPSSYPEDIFLHQFWYWSFHCSLSEPDCVLNCPPNASLAWLPVNHFDTAMSDASYNIYNAVYAVAHALHEMLLQQVQMQPVRNGEGMVTSPWKLHTFLKNIQFANPAGEQTPCSVCTESCDPGFWKSPQEEKASCCFDCTICSENEIANDTDVLQRLTIAHGLFSLMLQFSWIWATLVSEGEKDVQFLSDSKEQMDSRESVELQN